MQKRGNIHPSQYVSGLHDFGKAARGLSEDRSRGTSKMELTISNSKKSSVCQAAKRSSLP